eukprot:scaffold12957_cov148-Skeletonema_marinoi.AAC.5
MTTFPPMPLLPKHFHSPYQYTEAPSTPIGYIHLLITKLDDMDTALFDLLLAAAAGSTLNSRRQYTAVSTDGNSTTKTMLMVTFSAST